MFKLITRLMIVVMLISAMGISTSAEDEVEYTEPGLEYHFKEENININFLGVHSKEVTVLYNNGRLCVPFYTTLRYLGGSYVQKGRVIDVATSGASLCVPLDPDPSNKPVTFYYNGVMYISLYDLLEPMHFTPILNVKANRIVILGNHCNMEDEVLTQSAVDSSTALLRLEDIVADGLDPEGNYTEDNVEKLRYAAQYLYIRGQHYYIAWVPVYVNPKANITNDLTKDFNLYNANFLYTLDYMVDHNGHIGLHGYTHQYGEDKSCDGWEWGDKTPYTKQEQQERMVLAKQTAAKLGYKEEFFEFPHYGATVEQKEMAEKYFDAIYQSYADGDKIINKIHKVKNNGREVYYIPTPADYVKSANDREVIINTIQDVVNNQESVSMFYHPILDKKKLTVTTRNRERMWYYSDQGILPGIVNYIGSHHFVFSTYN